VRTKGEEGDSKKREEKRRGERRDSPQVLIRSSRLFFRLLLCNISESINKTWRDGGKTGTDGRERKGGVTEGERPPLL